MKFCKEEVANAIQEVINREKTNEINLMYIKAKALGFPDKVDFDRKVVGPVKVNTCGFVGPPEVIFFRSNENLLETLNEFSYDNYGMSCEVCSLLILMKIFYHLDWNGQDWVHMPVIPETDIQKEVVEDLAKKMAQKLDREILLDAYDTKTNKIKISERIAFGVKPGFFIKVIPDIGSST